VADPITLAAFSDLAAARAALEDVVRQTLLVERQLAFTRDPAERVRFRDELLKLRPQCTAALASLGSLRRVTRAAPPAPATSRPPKSRAIVENPRRDQSWRSSNASAVC